MKALASSRFVDQKNGFRQILADPHWLAKVMLGGFLLINPLLVALAPAYFSGAAPAWVKSVFPWVLGFNVLSFWFPLGFTFEVLRRARMGRGVQLPSWRWNRLALYAQEGAVKMVLAIPTLLLPSALWMAACYGVFIKGFGLPLALLSLFVPPILLLAIPFCGVACCRWLDGQSVLNAAFNYGENVRLFRKGCPDYLIASAFIIGINSVTTAFFYTIPFAAVFGLCLVDTWFGPIYAESVMKPEGKPVNRPANESVLV